jgi:hypothetical protein
MILNTAEFLRERENHVTTQIIPRNIKKKWLQPKAAHVKANARALTGAEMATKAADKEEKAAKLAEQARGQVQVVEQLETQDTITVAPRVLVNRTQTPTPPKPNPPQPPQQVPEQASFDPPPSTAPPAIGEASAKRTRGRTMDFVALAGKRSRRQ